MADRSDDQRNAHVQLYADTEGLLDEKGSVFGCYYRMGNSFSEGWEILGSENVACSDSVLFISIDTSQVIYYIIHNFGKLNNFKLLF